MRPATLQLAVFWVGLAAIVAWAYLAPSLRAFGLGTAATMGLELLLQPALAQLSPGRRRAREMRRRMAVNWLESTRTHLYRRRPYRWSR